jgi:hypothetical protein
MTSKSFCSTIRYDEEIARWAVRLMAHKAVKDHLFSFYESKARLFLPAHFFIMFLNLAIAGYVLKAVFLYKPYDLALIIGLLLLAYLIEIPYKNLLADNVTAFVRSEFTEDELKKITMLQMSVRLEQKYKTPELVDTVSGWMGIFRYGVVFVYGFLLLIFIPFSQAALTMLAVAWATRALARSSLLADLLVR